jgi:hypothetical protein
MTAPSFNYLAADVPSGASRPVLLSSPVAEAGAAVLAKPTPKPSIAYPVGFTVWIVGGLKCPNCQHELRATDVSLDRFGGGLICAGCHIDIARVERR